MKRYHAVLLAIFLLAAMRLMSWIEPCYDSSGHSCTAAERAHR